MVLVNGGGARQGGQGGRRVLLCCSKQIKKGGRDKMRMGERERDVYHQIVCMYATSTLPPSLPPSLDSICQVPLPNWCMARPSSPDTQMTTTNDVVCLSHPSQSSCRIGQYHMRCAYPQRHRSKDPLPPSSPPSLPHSLPPSPPRHVHALRGKRWRSWPCWRCSALYPQLLLFLALKAARRQELLLGCRLPLVPLPGCVSCVCRGEKRCGETATFLV